MTSPMPAVAFTRPVLINYVREFYSDLCDESEKPAACDLSSSEEDQLDNYFYLFMFAMMLQGFGSISLFTVGFTALEDSLSKDKAALYLGKQCR